MSLHHRFCLSIASLLLGGACLPLTAATIGYYQFEDTPGVQEDSGAGNRDLTLVGSAGGQVASTFGSVSNPPGGSVANSEAMSFSLNRGFTSADTSYADLTIESFISLNSTDSGTAARVIASQAGNSGNRAFTFGVAGIQSTTFVDNRTLFLQVFNSAGTLTNIDSSFRLTLGVNYYLAASIDAGASGSDGSVTFFLQDLTNGGSLQTATMTATGFNAFFDSSNVITIGSSGQGAGSLWDGVLDEVRLSDVALTSDQLLIAAIPEPSTYTLVLGGLVLVGVVCRRQRAAC